MNLDPPTYDESPDDLVTDVTVRITAEMLDEKPTGLWHVTCPAWKHETWTRNPTKAVAGIMADIEDHNEDYLEELAGVVHPISRWPSPIPDDGRMTPGRSIW